MGPSADAASCQKCIGNNVSTFGVCQECIPGLVSNADHSRCETCGVHRSAIASKNSESVDCKCIDEYYNSSEQIHVCYHGGYDASMQNLARTNKVSSVQSTGQSCETCPVDITGEGCLSCKGGKSLVSPGFMIPRITAEGGEDGEDVVGVYR